MRSVIFVAAVVLLGIAADGLEFGDIIYYDPTAFMIGDLYTHFRYRHVAVYVGDHDFPGKKPGQTVFERLRVPSGCRFSPLNMTRHPVVCNYLDGYEERGRVFSRGTVAEMEARVREVSRTCGEYNPVFNSCEHLATYVRYGKKIALQEGLGVLGFCFSEGVTRGRALKFVREQRAAGKLKCDKVT